MAGNPRLALIGYTGFVGKNLAQQSAFTHFYNSSNIETIRGEEFDEIICAGAYAEKWRANADPDTDRKNVNKLIAPLRDVTARQFILMSTVDVYPEPRGVDEASPIEESKLAPYGEHRLYLERFAQSHFGSSLIVRLPALFGPFLKKNAIYDLLHDNEVTKIAGDSRFQFYDITRLRHDITLAKAAKVDVINLATEPIRIGDIAREVFGRPLDDHPERAATYDFRTRHSRLWNRHDGYIADAQEILTRLRAYVQSEQASSKTQ